MTTATGGKWDRTAWPAYFIASNPETLRHAFEVNDHLLVAVNELKGDEDLALLERFIANGCNVFIDSGVFWLATGHAKAHGLSMDEGLSLAPDKIDGFDDLFRRYVETVTKIGDRAWGYIEIDQGGRENKIKTRARLEGLGLRPIPVYHPFNDGWDYFDYLAENYDRICFGNVVQADPETRRRLIATAWERRRKYPHLWIHALGLTASELTTAWPINSCDSSSWLSAVRWGRHHASSANKRCWLIGEEFNYDPAAGFDTSTGHRKARRMCSYEAMFTTLTMQAMANEARAVLGTDPAAPL